jgi:hypothetical protein
MSSRKKHLLKRVRKTMSNLSDEDLIKIVQNPPLHYTPFALQAAREELSKRKQMKTLSKDIATLREIKGDNSRQGPQRSNSTSCYIELWREKDFEGSYLLIEGPAEYEALIAVAEDWGNNIGSLRVGPDAFVLAYEDKGFRGEMIRFGPCQEIADLTDIRFDDEIDSMKIINSVRIFENIR